jgi:hypothetical protein
MPVILSVDDRVEISDLLARYCIALDTREFALLDEVFVDEVSWDYDLFGSGSGRDALRDILRAGLAKLDASQHSLSTHLATPTDTGVSARTYIQGQHVRQKARAGRLFMIGGWYLDEIVRTSDGWRIASRRFETAWMDGNPSVSS